MERINKNNDWIKAFHKHSLGDHNKSVDLVNETLKWRKRFGANDLLKPGKLPFDKAMLADANMFMRNKDKNGRSICKIFIF